MKKSLSFLMVVFSLFMIACVKQNEEKFHFLDGTIYCTVTFVQEGGEEKSFNVEKGKAFDENKIPQITATKTGYTAKWEETDFSSIQSDLVIYVVYTPNVYQILYYLTKDGELYHTQNVTYDAVFVLIDKPTNPNKEFVRWKCKNAEESIPDNVWTKAGNLELVAVWEDDEDIWSPFG